MNEQLQNELEEQARLLGMSAERECNLRGKVERLERELEQLKQTTTMSAIDTAIDKIIEEKSDAIAKMEWWRKEAERWRAQALDLDAQVESAIASMTTRMDCIERQLKQFTDIDL